ncbi:MAG: PKD domain-containing protein [Bacteroidota bacterium]
MKTINRFFALSLLILLCSCGSDDDDALGTDRDPVAGFTFETDELRVTFENTSSNANSYVWDFGDDTTSEEVDPVHTYQQGGTYTVILTGTNGTESNATTQSITVSLDPENVRLTSGFVITASSEDGSTTFLNYFAELPTGTVDLTQGLAVQNFGYLDTFDGAIFSTRTDGSNGYVKLGINGNGDIVEDGILPTTGSGRWIRVRDAETGVFSDSNNPKNLPVFNPTTMEVTGNIDLSAAPVFTEFPMAFVQTAVIRGDYVYAVMEEFPQFLDNFTVVRGSLTSGTFQNQLDSNSGVTFTGNFLPNVVDEEGNIFMPHGGVINLLAPIPGGILKIPANSTEFDPNFDLRPNNVLNPDQLVSTFSRFGYYQDGLGYGLAALENDPQALALLESVDGDISQLTEEQINLLLFLANTSEVANFVEIDLNTGSVAEVPNLPRSGPFASSNFTIVAGLPHFVVNNLSTSALYRYDPTVNETVEVFSATGATLGRVLDIGNDNL